MEITLKTPFSLPRLIAKIFLDKLCQQPAVKEPWSSPAETFHTVSVVAWRQSACLALTLRVEQPLLDLFVEAEEFPFFMCVPQRGCQPDSAGSGRAGHGSLPALSPWLSLFAGERVCLIGVPLCFGTCVPWTGAYTNTFYTQLCRMWNSIFVGIRFVVLLILQLVFNLIHTFLS